MRLGIGTYSFTWAIGVPGHPPPQPMSAFALLHHAQRLGVRVVQFCDNLPLTALAPSELDRFEAEQKRLGLAVELGTRGLEPGNLRRNLQLCQRLGSPFLRLVIDSHGDEPSPQEAVTRLEPVVRECRDAGVRLALENHDRFPCRTLAWMADCLGSDAVGICLDTVNSLGALEGPEQVVQVLGHRALCLHVKDFTIRRPEHQMGFLVEGCAAGQGKLNVPWLLQQLKDLPAGVNAILETWVTPGDSPRETIAREQRWADEGIRYLRTFLTE